ncbi:YkvA family protein [Hymenobacter weizhouensis]|uniref:YkvA family protein n=1 Tax=Hymenobacter sp. YIM 151500-1 TaxID=2987689 RepID=UPI002226E5DD|nr:YkvA family protein [Hymenobacter sp. YIM 151500-1]UYZ61887.1 YkvA family protein [Hymenobacter sp. YIM 151500-1]
MDKHNPQGGQIASSPLFKQFLGKAEDYLKRPTRLKQLLNDAYQKASEKKDLGTIAHEAWDTLQTLFRLIRSASSGEYQGLPTSTIIAAVAVTAYFLSPIDLIPDILPVLGLLDDVALVAWFSTTIKEELDKFHEWEKTRVELVEEPKDAKPAAASTMSSTDGTTRNSGPKPAAAPKTGSSNTDSGLGSPESSNPNPSRTTATDPAPKADVKPHADIAANTTDSSRTGNKPGPAGGDPGGNVR